MAEIKRLAFFGSAYGDVAFLLGSLFAASNETVLIRDIAPRPVSYCIEAAKGIDPATDIVSFKRIGYTRDKEAELEGTTIEFVLFGSEVPAEEKFEASICIVSETEEDLIPIRGNTYPKTDVNCFVVRNSSGAMNRFFTKAAKDKGFTDIRFFKPDAKENAVRLALEFTKRLQPGKEGKNMSQLLSDIFMTFKPSLTPKDYGRVVARAEKGGR